MCGIVGLHLRTAQLYPRLGELLTGMLCEMGDRGSDSAGVAVYGDPIWSPPGRACVSVLEVEPTAEAIGLDVSVTRQGDDVSRYGRHVFGGAARCDHGHLPRRADRRLRLGHGGAQGRWASARVDRCVGPGQGAGLAGRRSHQDGDRVRGDARGLPPLRRRARTVHGAQRFVRQSRDDPPRTTRRGCAIRQRERHRGRRAVHRPAVGRRSRRGNRAQGAVRDFDGFYTLLVSNRDSFAVVRDAIACKPAVIAETDDWVAMGANTARWRGFPASRPPRSGSRSRRWSTHGHADILFAQVLIGDMLRPPNGPAP